MWTHCLGKNWNRWELGRGMKQNTMTRVILRESIWHHQNTRAQWHTEARSLGNGERWINSFSWGWNSHLNCELREHLATVCIQAFLVRCFRLHSSPHGSDALSWTNLVATLSSPTAQVWNLLLLACDRCMVSKRKPAECTHAAAATLPATVSTDRNKA